MAQKSAHQRERTVIKKTFLVNQNTNRRFRLNGVKETGRKPEADCLRKDFSMHIIYRPSQLPAKVDLRPWMTKIEDQSDVNSCVANAMAGAYEYLVNKDTGHQIDISRLFVYYNSRVRALEDNERLTDDGSYIPDAIESIKELGVCLESLWPYDTKKVNVKPSKQCYAAAIEHTIAEALEVDINVNEMKTSLAQGFPLLLV